MLLFAAHAAARTPSSLKKSLPGPDRTSTRGLGCGGGGWAGGQGPASHVCGETQERCAPFKAGLQQDGCRQLVLFLSLRLHEDPLPPHHGGLLGGRVPGL